MILNYIKRLFSKRKEERTLSEPIDSYLQNYLDKYIADINDIKSDYLKKYLECRMDNVNLSISRLDALCNDLENRIKVMESELSELIDKHEEQ